MGEIPCCDAHACVIVPVSGLKVLYFTNKFVVIGRSVTCKYGANKDECKFETSSLSVK